MKIVILGPGALGCLIGGFLARAGEEVTLLDYRPDRAAKLNDKGLTLVTATEEFQIPIKATTQAEAIGLADLLIVLVKAFATGEAAQAARPCVGEQTAVLTLQNGLGNAETLAEIFGAARVIGGVTSNGATLLSTGEVKHTGSGETLIGEISGELTPRLEQIKQVFDRAGMPVNITQDLPGALWGKLVFNCAVNPIAALTGRRNGEILQEPSLVELLGAVAQEAAAVAAALGISLPYADPAAKVKQVCEHTAENVNSMLADILGGRRTEIDQINGAVVKAAQSLGQSAPLNFALTALVRGLAECYSKPRERQP
jgi:2-dehydropantoate 2-reductase